MPRQRDIVSLAVTPEQLQEHIRRRAVEVHEPYHLFKDKSGWLIRYTSPKDLNRRLVMDSIADKRTAKDLKALLEQAWVDGYLAKV